MFLKRSYQTEMMDDFTVTDERIDEALQELKIINKYLGGISVTKCGLKKIFSKVNPQNPVNILDAGGGASDVLLSLLYNYRIFSIDLNKRVAKYILSNTNQINVVCGNVLNLPFRKNAISISHLSLLLHHFNEEEIKKILSDIAFVSKYGIIINDLRRSVLAFAGIKLLTILFSKSEFVRNDGPVSVKRGFSKNDLTKILDDLNLRYEIIRKWAFRWLVVIYLNEK